MPKSQMLAAYTLRNESFRYAGLRFIKAQSECQREVLIGFQTARAIAWPQVFCALQASEISLKLDKSQAGQVAIVCESRGSADDLTVQIVNSLDSILKNATTRRHFFADKGWLLPSQGTRATGEEPDTSVATHQKTFWSKKRKLTLTIVMPVVALLTFALNFAPTLTLGLDTKGDTSASGRGSTNAPNESESKKVNSGAAAAPAAKRLSSDQVSAIVAKASNSSANLLRERAALKRAFEKIGVTVAFEAILSFGGVTQVTFRLTETHQAFAIQIEKSDDSYTLVKCRELK